MGYQNVLARIHESALRAGRAPTEIQLVIVSKGQPIEAILNVYEQGARLFGENRVQELLAKKPLLPNDIKWHLIGHLQTNKVKAILPHLSLLQALDRKALLTEIAKRASTPIPCLIEVKIAQEATKYGVAPEALDSFVELVLREPQILLKGLMGIASLTTDRQQIRQEFRRLYKLYERLKAQVSSVDTLSMGMSDDFEIAIEEGSTMVRIGRAIFS